MRLFIRWPRRRGSADACSAGRLLGVESDQGQCYSDRVKKRILHDDYSQLLSSLSPSLPSFYQFDFGSLLYKLRIMGEYIFLKIHYV